MELNSRHSSRSRSNKVHRKEQTTRAQSRHRTSNEKRNYGYSKKTVPVKPKRKYWTIGKKIAMTLSIMVLLLVAGAVGVVASKLDLLQMVALEEDNLNLFGDMQYEEEGYLNIALFGVDTRATDASMGTRSDTIMIASVNLETKNIRICSVYRDTLLQQKDDTYNKANAAYSSGGAEEAIAMLNKNLDMDIQHYVTVDFAALVHVIDALGGVEIEVTEEELPYINGYAVEIIENTGVDTWAVTAPGYQNLTGVQATAYARIRYTAGDDFKRAERQRTVLLKIAEKLKSANVTTLVNIIDSVFPMVETNFTLPEIFMYAKDIAKFNIGETSGFPFEKDTMSYSNIGDTVIALTLENNVIQLHQFLFPELDYTTSEQVEDIDAEIGWIYGGDYFSYSSKESAEESAVENNNDIGIENYSEEFY